MNKRVTNKHNKRSFSVILTVILVVLFLSFLVKYINLRVEIKNKNDTLEQLNVQYSEQLQENAELEALIEEGDEASYIERIAREQRGYVYADERVYYDVTPGSY